MSSLQQTHTHESDSISAGSPGINCIIQDLKCHKAKILLDLNPGQLAILGEVVIQISFTGGSRIKVDHEQSVGGHAVLLALILSPLCLALSLWDATASVSTRREMLHARQGHACAAGLPWPTPLLVAVVGGQTPFCRSDPAQAVFLLCKICNSCLTASIMVKSRTAHECKYPATTDVRLAYPSSFLIASSPSLLSFMKTNAYPEAAKYTQIQAH